MRMVLTILAFCLLFAFFARMMAGELRAFYHKTRSGF
jgi:hypothetical protein